MKDMQNISLFDRVVEILEQARSNVVRSVNRSMVTGYWLIGREIVMEIQGGDERAEYGKQVIENLSRQLTRRYGQGFSTANLKNFRQFYATYPDRLEQKGYPPGSELDTALGKSYPMRSELENSFSPQLSWSQLSGAYAGCQTGGT
jgi:hypothetical protein